MTMRIAATLFVRHDSHVILLACAGLRKQNRAVRKWVMCALSAAMTMSLAALLPAAAGAHPPAQQLPDASYYQARIIDPASVPAGVTARVDPGGEWLELSNSTAEPVIVQGYSGEPYLRITAGTAEENLLSQTTYLNRSLFADTVPAARGGTEMAPSWQRIAAAGTARWHDHRIHWMGRVRPPAVAADPGHPHQVGTWVIHATAGRTPFDIHGSLTWTGLPADSQPSPVTAWAMTVVAGLVVAAAAVVVVVIRGRRPQSRGSRWALPSTDAVAHGENLPGELEPAYPVGATQRPGDRPS
jgi:hypothetical protein